MKRAVATPLPLEDIQDRIADRIAEAMAVAAGSRTLAEFPAWTQRVMIILRNQLIPDEMAAVFTKEMTVFHEGVLTGFCGLIRQIAQQPDKGGRAFVKKLSVRLATNHGSKRVAKHVINGSVVKLPVFQRHVLKRLFAKNPIERRAFAEGLALGCRVFDLCAQQAERGQTEATPVYLMLWLYWPVIDEMKSVGDVGRALGLIFDQNPNLAGNWNERFRKIANRIKLSFRQKQVILPR